MKQNFCLKCNKETDSLLINKEKDFEESIIQCLVCGAEMGSMIFPPGTTFEFKGDWKKID